MKNLFEEHTLVSLDDLITMKKAQQASARIGIDLTLTMIPSPKDAQ